MMTDESEFLYLMWQGRIRFSGSRIQIDNTLANRRTLITLSSAVPSLHFVAVCSTISRVLVLLDDGSVFVFIETPNGSYRTRNRWILADQDRSYRLQDGDPDHITVIDSTLDESDRFSPFGLSITDNTLSDRTATSPRSLIACSNKHLYIAHASHIDSSVLDKLTRIDLDDNTVAEFTEFLSPGVGIRVLKCGFAHLVILDSLGCVHTAGFSTRGELGHGDLEQKSEPHLVDGLVGVRIRTLAVGGWHTVTVTEFGDAYVWGWNNDCQLGFDNETTSSAVEPQHLEFPDDLSVSAVACGSRHTVFLLENGDLYGCGWNGHKQLGDQSKSDNFSLQKLQMNSILRSPITNLSACGWTTLLREQI